MSPWPLILAALAVGALGGYAVGVAAGTKRSEPARTDAYRRGLQDGHNRLAAREARRDRRAREVRPRSQRDTIPDGW